MVVNQIAAQANAFPAIETAWRALLAVPADRAAADASIDAMNAALDAARAVSDTPAKIPFAGRTPSIASVMWAAQNDAWPPHFNSVANALVRDGLYDGEGYGTYCGALLALREALGASAGELEALAEGAREKAPAPSVAAAPDAAKPRRIWLIAPGEGAMHWDKWLAQRVITIGWNDVKNLSKYASEAAVLEKLRETRDGADPRGAARSCWKFGHVMAPGDIVYAKKGRSKILGRGEITSDYRHDPKSFDHHIRSVRWEKPGEWKTTGLLAMGTLTEIGKSPQLVKELADLVGGPAADELENDAASIVPDESYTVDDATKELFMSRDALEEILELWRHKKNLILQGPPGVGKTFVASRLAQLLIEGKEEEQICRVQFHPSYAYEDFVQGLRPTTTGGFERHDGPLLRFCKLALQDQERDFVLIIDEINRGNVSKILGELLSLLEADKRDPKYGVALAYSHAGEPRFHVPPNLFVIGMMNTADRALSLVDYALRRRFVFIDVAPAFGREELRTWWRTLGLDGPLRSRIEQRLIELNKGIAKDAALGPGYAIGHSYFCQENEGYDATWFERILKYEIEPLLREYWFDTPAKVDAAMTALRA